MAFQKALINPDACPICYFHSDTGEGGTLTPTANTTIKFCRNGGTWENGRCVCPEEWRGWRCTIPYFCERSTSDDLTFARIPVGKYGSSQETCGENTLNVGYPIATRMCNISIYGKIVLENVTKGNCDENLKTLENKIDNMGAQLENISIETQILTSNVSKMTPENITSAARVVGQIFNTSRNASIEAKDTAVSTVSQLLSVSENVFQEVPGASPDDDAFTTLIQQMESYSLSLNNNSVVKPNVAVQTVLFSTKSTVLFSVKKGDSDSLISGSITVDTNVSNPNPDAETELQILLNTSKRVPAIVVALTMGIIFCQNRNDPQWELEYRQEEICWLEVPDKKDLITSPFLWSFVLPVTIILINNIVIFIIIIVKVIWKNNRNLTSTKKVSSLKKILSMLSIAVVFGITWILAYLMLIDNDVIRTVFSYMFCLFNTTQGLQIFVLYTVRTKIFQDEASKVLKLLSLSTGRKKSLPSATSLRLRVRMYNMLRSFPALNEHFRLLEPSVITEETTLSESDQANPSI